AAEPAPPRPVRARETHATVTAFGTAAPQEAEAPARERRAPVATQEPKVGRNDPCPCGSGKKYKKCHGA
ncbi:MAG: SEC-C metal-binding domain-containing protein, partial [Bacteroidota bacterium]